MPRKIIKKDLTPEQMLKKIRQRAQIAAAKGQPCLNKQTLKTERGYTDDQADIYILSFNEKVGTTEEQALKKARQAARNAVDNGRAVPSQEYLKNKMQFSDAQVKVYLEKFHSLAKNPEEQQLKKAHHAGKCAVLQGGACLTKEALINKGYTEKEADKYLAAYQSSKSSKKEQAVKSAKTSGRAAARVGSACPSESALKKRGYTKVQIHTYKEAYNASAGTKEDQESRKILMAQQKSANHKKVKDNTKRIKANQEGCKKSADNQNEQMLRPQVLSDIAENVSSLWEYAEEVFQSDTSDKAQGFNELEHLANDNSLFFGFNSEMSTPSLTDSNFLAFFQETDEKSEQETCSSFEFSI